METISLDAWRNRKMVVTVKEHCPHCGTLGEEVKSRTFWLNYTRKDHTCCRECVPKIEAEYRGY